MNKNTTSWCFMPPEMHFNSPQELREAISLFQMSRLSKVELQNSHLGIIPPEGKFERIQVSKGNYILLPTAIDYAYLFRGQGADYPKNLPTLYRQPKTAEEVFIQRMKITEFKTFLQQLPQIKFFEKMRYNIDYLGLAQHYGFQTEVMDLTSDIDVALFFAMCDLPQGQSEYVCKQVDKPYIGYLYCVPAHEFLKDGKKMVNIFWGTKISAIGLQPFERPGAQKGFAIHLDEGEELKSLVYSFSYTREDSEAIFRKFSQGKALWQDDYIAKVARLINDSKQFSFNTFNACVKSYGSKHIDYRKQLRDNGYILCKQPAYMQSSLIQSIIDDYQGEWKYQQNIVARRYREADGPIHQCLSLQAVTSQMILQVIESGCPAPEGYITDDGFEKDSASGMITISSTIYPAKVQTHPDPKTGKVTRWTGDWSRELKIELGKDKLFERKLVKVR